MNIVYEMLPSQYNMTIMFKYYPRRNDLASVVDDYRSNNKIIVSHCSLDIKFESLPESLLMATRNFIVEKPLPSYRWLHDSWSSCSKFLERTFVRSPSWLSVNLMTPLFSYRHISSHPTDSFHPDSFSAKCTRTLTTHLLCICCSANLRLKLIIFLQPQTTRIRLWNGAGKLCSRSS